MKTYYRLNRNRLLSHLHTSFCALAILGALLALPSAEAGTPGPASGEFFPCFTRTGVRPVGENLIVTFNITGKGNGTFDGTFIGTELDVVHSDGSITLEGSLVFTSSDKSGTLLFTYTGIGNFNTGRENLRAAGRQGTGSLSGVEAERTLEGDVVGACADDFVGDFGGHGTYSGQILYAP
jgi:hypothetical protein